MGIVKASGVCFINKKNEVLLAHPTNHDKNFWSIPKGKLEDGEEVFDAALRETFEETNVDLSCVTKTHEMDYVRYKHGKKKVKIFIIFEDENECIDSTTFDLKCNSYVEEGAKWNSGLPEMDDFKWFTIEEAREVMHYTQVVCLDIVLNLIKKKNG